MFWFKISILLCVLIQNFNYFLCFDSTFQFFCVLWFKILIILCVVIQHFSSFVCCDSKREFDTLQSKLDTNKHNSCKTQMNRYWNKRSFLASMDFIFKKLQRYWSWTFQEGSAKFRCRFSYNHWGSIWSWKDSNIFIKEKRLSTNW